MLILKNKINEISKNPQEQIKRKNSWYVSNQSDELEHRKNLKKVFENRVKFITDYINYYQLMRGIFYKEKLKLKLLDAGCGDGVLLERLSKISNLQLYGMDYNPQRVLKARNNVPKADIKIGDLKNMSYPKEYFDIIILSQVLEHIVEDVVVLRNLYDAMNDKGIFILGVPNEGCLLARFRNKIIEPNIMKTTDHVNFYTENKIREKLSKVEFKVLKIMRENFFYPHQFINRYMNTYNWSYHISNIFGKIIISQVAGYYFVCGKE